MGSNTRPSFHETEGHRFESCLAHHHSGLGSAPKPGHQRQSGLLPVTARYTPLHPSLTICTRVRAGSAGSRQGPIPVQAPSRMPAPAIAPSTPIRAGALAWMSPSSARCSGTATDAQGALEARTQAFRL